MSVDRYEAAYCAPNELQPGLRVEIDATQYEALETQPDLDPRPVEIPADWRFHSAIHTQDET